MKMRFFLPILLIASSLLPTGCATLRGTSLTSAERQTLLYQNALTALSVVEQGLQTWELLAAIQGKLSDEEIAAQREVWNSHIAALRAVVTALEPPNAAVPDAR